MNEESIHLWVEECYKTNMDVIEDLSTDQVKQLIKNNDYVLVYVCEYSSI